MFHSYLSFGKWGQWVAATVITLCTIIIGEFDSWTSAALPKIDSGSAGFVLSHDEAALTVTLVFIGNLLSPIPCGVMMDRIGRRNTLAIGLALAMVAWLILALSTATAAIYVSRLLGGAWGGFVHTVVPAYMGEVVDPQIRGAFGAFYGLSFYLGGLYESLAGLANYDWFIYISAIPSIVLFLASFFLPESPYFYLKMGKREKAKAAIIWLKGDCSDEDLDFIQANVEEQMAMKGSYLDIFRNKAGRKAFFIVEVMYICQRLSGMTFLLSYVTVIVPNSDDGSWVSPQDFFVVLMVSWIIFSALSTFIMDSFGRKTLLGFSCLGLGLCMGGNTVWYYLRDKTSVDTSNTNWLPLLLLVVSGLFYCVGIVSIPALLQSELYPINLKSKGSALACITANIFSGLGTQFFYDIKEDIGLYFNFLVMTITPFLWLIFTWIFVIETKGKSLETIQDILNGREKKETNSDEAS